MTKTQVMIRSRIRTLLENWQMYFALSIFIVVYVCPPDAEARQQTFEEYREQQTQSLEQYVSEQDAAFASFLRETWSEIDLALGLALQKEKPVTLPEAEPEEASSEGTGEPSSEKMPDHTPDRDSRNSGKPSSTGLPDMVGEPDLPDTPRIPPLPPLPNPNNALQIQLFGLTTPIPRLSSYEPEPLTDLSSERLADHWLVLAKTDYEPVVDRLRDVIRSYSWNDWAAARLIRNYAESLVYSGAAATSTAAITKTGAQGNENAVIALTWFLLTKLDYTAHVGYVDNTLVLLLASDTPVYLVPSIRLDGFHQPLYAMSTLNREPERIQSLYTYLDDDFVPAASLNLQLQQNPAVATRPGSRTLTFTFASNTFELELQYDEEIVNFMETYPQTRLEVYAQFNGPGLAGQSLLSALAPLLVNRTTLEKLNLLLRFVQTAFDYQTDTEQFQRERYMTPDEILYYPYSDCDDRTLLFTFLVKNLLDAKVIGLEYSKHVAAAVRMYDLAVLDGDGSDASVTDLESSGDVITYNGEAYLVADPTYINADAGMSMPGYANEQPIILDF